MSDEHDGSSQAPESARAMRGGLPEDDPGLVALRSVNSHLRKRWWLPKELRTAAAQRDAEGER